MRNTRRQPQPLLFLVPALALGLLVFGCASHKFVRSEDEATRAELGRRIDEVAVDVEDVRGEIGELETSVAEQDGELEALSATAQDALDRAIAAGKLAEGKFLYETVLSDDNVRFGVEQAQLSEESRQALDRFADELKEHNEDVYLEIQGHTDSTGDDAYNLLLGEQRAEAVRRYLTLEHGFALHRTATLSYGESAPVADNSTPEGRERNRRVSLVVLR